MSAFTDYLEVEVLNHVFRGIAYTSPTNLYVALFTDVPGDDGTGTEVSGGAYTRQQVVLTAPTQVGGKAQTENNAELEWPTATADWGTVQAAAIYDAATGGNMLAKASLATARLITENDILRVPAGDLTVSLD